jgi:hypothetical protein
MDIGEGKREDGYCISSDGGIGLYIRSWAAVAAALFETDFVRYPRLLQGASSFGAQIEIVTKSNQIKKE